MDYLLDTNVLVRMANIADPQFAVATWACSELHRGGDAVHITAQNLIEFRAVATRPKSSNGLDMTPTEAESLIATYKSRFAFLVETPQIFPAWTAIVENLGVVGKQVHDARLVAVCHVHAVTHLLTFNVNHFQRLTAYGPRVIVVDPATI